MSYQVKKIDADSEEDLLNVNKIAVYAFHHSPSSSDLSERMDMAKYRDKSDQYLVLDGDEAVASSTIHPLLQNVRSRIIKCGGVATIGTLPHARRKGHVRRLMNKMFEDMKTNNQVVSVLHPFDERYYEKFGYVTLPDRLMVSFKPEDVKGVFQFKLNGETKVGLMEDNLDEYFNFLSEELPTKRGMIQFDKQRYEQFADNEQWLLQIYDGEDRIIGMVVYEITGYLKDLRIHAMELSQETQAKYHLLEFIGKHMGQVEKVKFPIRKSDEVERWLSGINLKYEVEPGAMSRVIDVIGLADKNFKIDMTEQVNSVVVKITDDYCDWNDDTFIFSNKNGILGVEKATGVEANIEVDIRALSGFLYGYYDKIEMMTKDWIIAKNTEGHQDLNRLLEIFTYEPHELKVYF